MAVAARASRKRTKGTTRARRPAGSRGKAPALPMPAVLLDATAEPDVVEVQARTVLAIDGAGPPDGEPFAKSLGALYGATYGLEFARKKAGGAEFKVPRSFAKVDAALAAAGLAPAREHLEVYLSDPRRTAPARLRTVLLREVRG